MRQYITLSALTFLLTLTSLNLLSQESWVQLGGPDGGYCDEIGSAGNGTIYVEFFGESQLLYRSDDYGESYVPTTLTAADIQVIDFTSDEQPLIVADNKLYTTLDSGNTFQVLKDSVSSLVVFGEIIYAGGPSLFYSTDNGNTWVEIPTDFESRLMAVSPNGDLYVSFYQNGYYLYKRESTGEGWIFVTDQIEIEALAVNNLNELLVGNSWGLYRSTDGGFTWSQAVNTYVVSTIAIADSMVYLMDDYGGGLYISADNGYNWSFTFGDLPGLTRNDMTADSTGSVYVTTTDGVYVSPDFVNWEHLNNGILHTNISDVFFSTNGNLFSQTHSALWLSEDSGETWQRIFPVHHDDLIADTYVHDNGDIYVIYYKYVWDKKHATDPGEYCDYDYCGKVMRSTDNGATWEEVVRGLMLFSVTVDHNDIIYTHSDIDGFMRSTDNGSTWTVLNNQFYVRSPTLKVSPENHLYIYSGNVYVSEDQGENWTSLNLTASEFDWIGPYMFAWTSDSLLRSSDNYLTQEVLLSSTDYIIHDVKGLNGKVVMATSAGVMQSLDMGETWELVSDNFFYNEVYSVAITPSEHIIAPIINQSLWQTTTPVSALSSTPLQVLHIWPNPSQKGSVTVYSGTTKPSTINIYNLQGQLLISRSTHLAETMIDVSNLHAGIYLVKVNESGLKLVINSAIR